MRSCVPADEPVPAKPIRRHSEVLIFGVAIMLLIPDVFNDEDYIIYLVGLNRNFIGNIAYALGTLILNFIGNDRYFVGMLSYNLMMDN